MVAAAATLGLGALAPALLDAAPVGAADGVTYTCEKSPGYDCMPGTGYTGQSTWGSYGPGHNCVSFVAFMLQRNGSERPWEGRLGDGSDWDEHARAAGYPVDTNPTVGAIAQWDGGSGHVAYVDEVTTDHIVVTEDSFSGDSSARRIARTSSTFAEAEFLHIRDLPAAPADDVLWATDAAGTTMWWGAAGDVGFRVAPTAVELTRRDAPVAGDLDGDGATDLLLHPAGSTRATIAWGDGRGAFGERSTRSVPAGGRARPLVGDLDGDDVDDVVWYGRGPADDAIWWGRAGQRGGEVSPLVLDGRYLPAVGDFDGDGVDDLVLVGAGDLADRVVWGRQGVRRLLTRRLAPTALAASASPVVGDLDGDGRDDIAWARPGPGRDAIWWGEADRAPTRRPLDLGGLATPRSGDFDGDGADDLLVVGAGGTDDVVLQGTVGQRTLTPAPAPTTAPASAIAVTGEFGPG